MAKEYIKTCSFSDNTIRRAVLGHYVTPAKKDETKPTMTEKLHGKKPKNRYVQW